MKKIQGNKYIWQMPIHEQHTLLECARTYNISLPIAEILITRGYTTKEEIEAFLFSSYEKDVMHPALLKDAQKAVDRIVTAINRNEKILVFGDYDVDGITSSALMMLCLKPLGAYINFFLPHRVKDGYGLSTSVVERAAKNDYAVIITVDNGIAAFEPAQRAKELGVDLIITDHHRPHTTVPDAFAIVNPNQEGCQYPYKNLAGVGVTFKLLSLLYETMALEIPHKALELLLLGTIADVVPLTGENRFWVRHCLQFINRSESYAFKVLKKNANITKPALLAADIGFSIAPQINALGRLEDPREGVKFLIGANRQETEQVGTVLFELNQARKEIERSIFSEIVLQIERNHINLEQENIILAASEQWPPGVIGLVASRLVAAYGKPALLFHITNNGIAKGSCRSISAFNMFDALHQARDILISFGGHSMAAGLSLHADQLPALKQMLEDMVAAQLTPEDLQQKIAIDAQLSLSEVNKKIVTDLQYLEPFGQENPQPVFYIKQVSLVQPPLLLKDAHVKCSIFADGVIKPVIFFNRPELFPLLKAQEQEPFDITAHVTQNHWQGNTTIELIGVDIAHGKDLL